MSVLAGVVVGDGACLFYEAVRTEKDHFYLKRRRIAEVRSLADKAKGMGESEASEERRWRRGGSSRS